MTAVERFINELRSGKNLQFEMTKCGHLITEHGNVFDKILELEKQQHGQTWDAAIAAHDNRGHVHARSLVDFDEWYDKKFKK
jgi:hypothetical protein